VLHAAGQDSAVAVGPQGANAGFTDPQDASASSSGLQGASAQHVTAADIASDEWAPRAVFTLEAGAMRALYLSISLSIYLSTYLSI
jgi:hypothetical protein